MVFGLELWSERGRLWLGLRICSNACFGWKGLDSALLALFGWGLSFTDFSLQCSLVGTVFGFWLLWLLWLLWFAPSHLCVYADFKISIYCSNISMCFTLMNRIASSPIPAPLPPYSRSRTHLFHLKETRASKYLAGHHTSRGSTCHMPHLTRHVSYFTCHMTTSLSLASNK